MPRHVELGNFAIFWSDPKRELGEQIWTSKNYGQNQLKPPPRSPTHHLKWKDRALLVPEGTVFCWSSVKAETLQILGIPCGPNKRTVVITKMPGDTAGDWPTVEGRPGGAKCYTNAASMTTENEEGRSAGRFFLLAARPTLNRRRPSSRIRKTKNLSRRL